MIATDNDAPVASIRGVSAVGRSGRDDTFSQGGGLRADLRSTAPMPNPMRAPTPRSHLRDTTVNCFPRYRAALPAHAARTFVRVVAVAIVGCTLAACRTPDPTDAYGQSRPDQSDFNPAHYGAIVRQAPRPPHKWTKFVSVRGQPEPVPVEWVATPAGKFAHDIVIPDPVPKDSGYRWSMSATEYFAHLCDTEAGVFVYEVAKGVEGFLMMRPPFVPNDRDLKDQFYLEAPVFQSLYQTLGRTTQSRGIEFVSPPYRVFKYFEEPLPLDDGRGKFIQVFDYEKRTFRLTSSTIAWLPRSEYAMTWRGLRRPRDRENGIAGTELIITEIASGRVMGVLREFGISGYKGEFWWLNASRCPSLAAISKGSALRQSYSFVTSILNP